MNCPKCACENTIIFKEESVLYPAYIQCLMCGWIRYRPVPPADLEKGIGLKNPRKPRKRKSRRKKSVRNLSRRYVLIEGKFVERPSWKNHPWHNINVRKNFPEKKPSGIMREKSITTASVSSPPKRSKSRGKHGEAKRKETRKNRCPKGKGWRSRARNIGRRDGKP